MVGLPGGLMLGGSFGAGWLGLRRGTRAMVHKEHTMSRAEKPKWNDRHNISKPSSGLGKTSSDAAQAQQQAGQTVQWAGWRNGVKDRISELFKTVGGLASHVGALQSSYTSLSNGVKKKEIDADDAKGLFKETTNAIIKSADNTTPTDIATTPTWEAEFTCPEISGTFRIERIASGKIIHAYSC